MTGSVALDVVIGLIFVFLLYSLLASVLSEMIATRINLRARVLMKAIIRMLNNPDVSLNKIQRIVFLFGPMPIPQNNTFANKFYSHSLLRFLAKSDSKKPSYLAGKDFSKVIVDLLTKETKEAGESYAEQIKEFFAGVDHQELNLDPTTFKFLKNMWAESQGDLERFRTQLENWFDNTMERTTGWYKKYTQAILFTIGLCIAVVFNVDSIAIASKLKSDPELRKQAIEQADNFMKSNPDLAKKLATEKRELAASHTTISTDADSLKSKSAATWSSMVADSSEYKYIDSLMKRQDSLSRRADNLINGDIKNINDILGLGYTEADGNMCHIITHSFCGYNNRLRLLGWILSAIAISLGAPFWFDMLNKLMQLRGALKIPNTGASKGEENDGKTVQTPNRVG